MLKRADVYLVTEGSQVPASPVHVCMGLSSLGMSALLHGAPSRSEAMRQIDGFLSKEAAAAQMIGNSSCSDGPRAW
jgi:hypothetical protein